MWFSFAKLMIDYLQLNSRRGETEFALTGESGTVRQGDVF